jgi:hypothetical protein
VGDISHIRRDASQQPQLNQQIQATLTRRPAPMHRQNEKDAAGRHSSTQPFRYILTAFVRVVVVGRQAWPLLTTPAATVALGASPRFPGQRPPFTALLLKPATSRILLFLFKTKSPREVVPLSPACPSGSLFCTSPLRCLIARLSSCFRLPNSSLH